MSNEDNKYTHKPIFENPNFPELLTRREIELLYWMAAGRSNTEMAELLHISNNTVRYHLKNVYKKLDVTNKAAAVSTATTMGLILVPGSQAKQVVQQVYNAFVEGDISPFLAILDENTEWISTAPQTLFPHAGLYRGVEDIMKQITVIGSIYESRSFLPRIFVEEANQLAVYLDVSLIHRESGNEMFFDVAHFWTFKQGKVARYVEIFNSAIAQDQQTGRRE